MPDPQKVLEQAVSLAERLSHDAAAIVVGLKAFYAALYPSQNFQASAVSSEVQQAVDEAVAACQ